MAEKRAFLARVLRCVYLFFWGFLWGGVAGERVHRGRGRGREGVGWGLKGLGLMVCFGVACSLRGARTTNALVKEFWIACRGSGFGYVS